MSFNECNYIVRHVFDKEMSIPGYSTVIAQMAQLRVPTSPLYFYHLLNKCIVQDVYLCNIYMNINRKEAILCLISN